MDSIISKLFDSKKINSPESILGGLLLTCKNDGDTNFDGGGYDITKDTKDASGNSTGTDNCQTGPSTPDLDKPINC